MDDSLTARACQVRVKPGLSDRHGMGEESSSRSLHILSNSRSVRILEILCK